MSRIGTESAFEVLARARALEAQGRHIIHLEIGQPDFPTPAHIKEAAKQALDDGWTGYGPTAGLPECRDAIAQYVSATRAIDVTAANVCVVPGGKPIMYFVMTALLEPGDEVIYPNPGFPIYESLVDFLGATRVPMPLVEERGLLVRPRSVRAQPVAAHEARGPELAGQSHRRRDPEGRSGADRGSGARPRPDRAQRRDLLADLVRRAAGVDHAVRRAAAEDRDPRRVLEDLFDDRLAARLRRDAGVAGRGRRAPDGELELVHRQLHAAGRHRGAAGAAGLRGRDGGRVPPAPRRDGGRLERHPRLPLHRARGRVLRVPERHAAPGWTAARSPTC